MDVQGHTVTEDDPCDVLPLDFVVGVDSEAPMGLMAKAVDVCLAVEVSGIPDDAGPDDEALLDGCVHLMCTWCHTQLLMSSRMVVIKTVQLII